MSIDDRYERLLRRRAPSEIRTLAKFAEAYEQQPGKSTKYLLGAIAPVERKRTDALKGQGNRVEEQLTTRLKAPYPNLGFRRQGSVSNNTHIRYYSDVDVLVIIDKFHSLEHPQQPTNPYPQETANQDLLDLRNAAAKELGLAFPAVKVDNSGTKSLALTGGSLICKVDVVPANWLNTNAFVRGEGDDTRGIEVLDKVEMKRVSNYPFLFNKRLEDHDARRSGLPRMLVRLLKTMKADHEEETPQDPIELSSFDLCSLVYRMPDQYLSSRIYQPLDVIRNLLLWIAHLRTDEVTRSSLMAIDDSRKLFDTATKAPGLAKLQADLQSIYEGAVKEQGGYQYITEAHLKD
jgi:hypothetical protein